MAPGESPCVGGRALPTTGAFVSAWVALRFEAEQVRGGVDGVARMAEIMLHLAYYATAIKHERAGTAGGEPRGISL